LQNRMVLFFVVLFAFLTMTSFNLTLNVFE
jgi:hypothetical protein